MLKLKKLVVTNFGPFKGKREFDFSDGFTLIKARNGSGKTTLLSSIRMVLLDDYSESYETYINNESDFFNVSLDFENDNHDYNISLECKRGKSVTSTRVLKDNNGDLASGDEAKKVLAEIINPSLGKYALISTQSLDNSITKCKDAERRDIMKKVSDLVFDKQVDSIIKPRIDAIKKSIVEVDKEIYALENYPYKEFGDKKEKPFTESELEKKSLELDKLKVEKSLFDSQKKQYEEKKSAIEKLENQIKSDNAMIKTQETSLAVSKKNKSEKENLLNSVDSKLEEKISQIKSSYENKRKYLTDLLNTSNSSMVDLDNRLANIKILKLVKFNESKLTDKTKRLAEIEYAIKDCNVSIESLANGICPTCGGNCSHKTEEFKSKLVELESEKSSVSSEIENFKKEKSDYEEKAELNNKNKSLKDSLNSQKTVVVEKINNANNQLLSIDEYESKEIESAKTLAEESKVNYSSLIKSYSEDIKSKEEMIDNLWQKIEEMNREYVLKKEELEGLSVDTFAKDDVIYAIEKDISVCEEIDSFNKNLENNKKEQEQLKKDNCKKLEELKLKKQNMLTEQFNLESAKQIMTKDFPNYVLDTSIQNIEDNINDFMDNVYYKSMNIKFRPTSSSIKMEFGSGDKKLPISKLSGAENALVSIGFVEHFNRILDLKTILLDEPDAPLDSTTVTDFREALVNMGNVFEQVIIVSHDETLQNYLCSCTECNLIQL